MIFIEQGEKNAIIVDADACPVKEEIICAAAQFRTRVIMVASHNHRLVQRDGVEIVQVDASDQSADLYIANRLRRGDILITQDYGLAAVGLGKQAFVLSPRGAEYSNETISFLLDRRHIESKRRRGGFRTKGPKSFTDADRALFFQTLMKILQTGRRLNSIGE